MICIIRIVCKDDWEISPLSGTVASTFYFLVDDHVFPESDCLEYSDFPIDNLEAWIDTWIGVLRKAQKGYYFEKSFFFYDGPYSLIVKQKEKMEIEITFFDDETEVIKTTSNCLEFSKVLLQAAGKVKIIAKEKAVKIDVLNKLMILLKQEMKNL